MKKLSLHVALCTSSCFKKNIPNQYSPYFNKQLWPKWLHLRLPRIQHVSQPSISIFHETNPNENRKPVFSWGSIYIILNNISFNPIKIGTVLFLYPPHIKISPITSFVSKNTDQNPKFIISRSSIFINNTPLPIL